MSRDPKLMGPNFARDLARMLIEWKQVLPMIKRLAQRGRRGPRSLANEFILLAKTNAAIPYGSKGDVTVWTPSASSGTSTTARVIKDVRVFCIPSGTQIRSGDEVYIGLVWGENHSSWHVIQALNCPEAIPDTSS